MTAVLPSKPGRIIRKGIEAFYEGDHVDSQGNPFHCSREDLADMAKNFSVLAGGDRPVLQPPVGIDHDTAKYIPDEFLSNPKLAMGDVVAAYTGMGEIKGKPTMFLFTDVALEPKTNMLVKHGFLTAVSAEVDDRPIDGAKGYSLRRLSLLGTNQPALKYLKRLGTLPSEEKLARFSERRGVPAKPRVQKLINDKGESQGVAFFCEMGCSTAFKEEGTTMPREELLTWLQSKGVDTSTVTDAIPDAFLQMLVDVMTENEKLKADAPADKPADMSDKPTGREPKQVTMRYSDFEGDVTKTVTRMLAPAIAKIETRLSTNARNEAALAKTRTHREIRSFAEEMVTAGKMRSADIECDKDGNPMPLTEMASLFRASEHAGVHSFSEAGKTVQGTALEVEMAKIKARPARMFREQVPAQKAGGETGGKSAKQAAQERANAYADNVLKMRGQKVG